MDPDFLFDSFLHDCFSEKIHFFYAIDKALGQIGLGSSGIFARDQWQVSLRTAGHTKGFFIENRAEFSQRRVALTANPSFQNLSNQAFDIFFPWTAFYDDEETQGGIWSFVSRVALHDDFMIPLDSSIPLVPRDPVLDQ